MGFGSCEDPIWVRAILPCFPTLTRLLANQRSAVPVHLQDTQGKHALT